MSQIVDGSPVTIESGETVRHDEFGEVEIVELVTFSEEFEVQIVDGELTLQSTTPEREKVKFETEDRGIIAHDLSEFLSDITIS